MTKLIKNKISLIFLIAVFSCKFIFMFNHSFLTSLYRFLIIIFNHRFVILFSTIIDHRFLISFCILFYNRFPSKALSVALDCIQTIRDAYRYVIITSSPLCCALQLLISNEPLIKSFCTSMTRNALTGRTI